MTDHTVLHLKERDDAFDQYLIGHQGQQAEAQAKGGKIDLAQWWAFLAGWEAHRRATTR